MYNKNRRLSVPETDGNVVARALADSGCEMYCCLYEIRPL